MSSFVIETPPMPTSGLAEETSRLTEALKKRVEDLPAADGNTSTTVDTLRAICPTDDGLAFDSLYQLAQYLNASLLHSFGDKTQVTFQPTDTDGASEGQQSITIRNAGVLVELKLLVEAKDPEGAKVEAEDKEDKAGAVSKDTGGDPAERSLTIQEFLSKGQEDSTKPAVGKAKAAAPTKRSPARKKADKVNYDDEEEDDEENQSTDSEDEVIAVMSKRTRTKATKTPVNKRRTVAKRGKGGKKSPSRKKFPQKIQLEGDDDEEEEEDVDMIDEENREPKESAGEAQKSRFAEQWETMRGKLEAYKKEHGDCLVPKDYPLDQSLGSWVHAQRSNYRLKTMPQERMDALQALGFQWKIRDIQPWDGMYERLQVYHLQNGDADVPGKYKDDPRLGRWVQQQRRDYREGKLSDDKIAMMENLDFTWKKIGGVARGASSPGKRRENLEEWSRMLGKLANYKEEHGDCLVPRDYEKDLELGRWVRQQRTRKSLSDDQKSKLNALGFAWRVAHKKKAVHGFEEMLERLKVFRERYGDCMVPALYPDDMPLGRWVQRMRQDYKKNMLTDQQIFEMDSLGFTWKCARGRQKINYETDIPNYFQSQEYLQKFTGANSDPLMMDPEQAPEQEGAIWSPKTAPEFWQAQFEKLVAFKAKHGHTNVPRNHFEDMSLAKWIVAQRSFYHKNQLSEEHIQKLESIGFVWRIQRHWEENFQLLKAYHDVHGNTDVPIDYAEDPKLGRWVREQRLFSKRKELTQERLDRMKGLGFVWNAPGASSALTKRSKSMTSAKDPPPPPLTGADGVAAAESPAAEQGGSSSRPVASVALKEKTAKLQQANAKLGVDRKNLKMENQELRRKLREAEEKNLWDNRYEELQVYKDLNGNCLVPTAHSKLGGWVGTQRDLYRKGALSQERIEQLESLGFVWDRPRGRPKKEEGGPTNSGENEDLLEDEVNLQEEKVRLLEAKVKLQQEKLKLRLIKESPKNKRESTGGDASSSPKAKKARTGETV